MPGAQQKSSLAGLDFPVCCFANAEELRFVKLLGLNVYLLLVGRVRVI
jgi:hypothetical protein